MIDAHAHIGDREFASDIDAVLERAAAAGVTRILAVGEDLPRSEAAVALAQRSPLVRAAVGVHPHHAGTFTPATVGALRALARDDRVVAIGEIGLDFSGRSAPREDQERALALQLELAAELSLPVSLHVRAAGPEVRAAIDRVRGIRGYVHCYSEDPAAVEEWLQRGSLISFAGTVTYPRAKGLRVAAARVPEDRLLLETDAPVLAPQSRRGQRNEPAFIASTYEAVAAVRRTAVPDLARAVAGNAASLFGPRW